MNELSNWNAVFLLKNGMELIISFLVLSQFVYFLTRIKLTKIAAVHATFLGLLFFHFVLLNSHHYFGIELVDGNLFYIIYGPIILIMAGFLQNRISEQKVVWLSSGLLLAGILLFWQSQYADFIPLLLLGAISASLLLVREIEWSLQKKWFTTFCFYFFFLVGVYPVVYLFGTVSEFLLFKIPYCIVFILFLIHNFSFFIGNPKFFSKNTSKTKMIAIDDVLIEKVVSSLESSKIYLRKSLTLNELALEIGEPTYKISKVLKLKYKKSFPELINHYRINDAKQVLANSHGDFVKIEALGFDVGFNAPSAFYSAFKKETGMTPKDFQRKTVC